MQAPLVSTIIAIGLIPVAFFFAHALIGALRGWQSHRVMGLLGVTWDLSMSIGYMLYRAFGGEVGGHVLELTGPVYAYFMVHGLVAAAVILLEVSVLTTGLLQWKRGKPIAWHRRFALPLFGLWWLAFLSGEVFYLVVYVL